MAGRSVDETCTAGPDAVRRTAPAPRASTESTGAVCPVAPAWAQPGSATQVQVAPPADFHRPSRTVDTPIGVFDGQSDIGSALLPGSASYEFGTKRYTVNSAGYKVWYTRDEFRYLWKKMSGDVSLAAGIQFPDANGYVDRKAVLIIRQGLDDDSKEAIAALHGLGMIHLAQRPERTVRVTSPSASASRRLLLTCARQDRYGSALWRGARELRRQDPLVTSN